MRQRSLLVFICCICSFCYAQDDAVKPQKSLYPDNRRWMLSYYTGVNVNLPYTNSNPHSELFSSRREVGVTGGYRVTHLLTQKFGWYANLQINIYNEYPSDYYDMHFSEAIARALALPFTSLHPSFDVGMIYRLEYGRWKIHPEVGLGLTYYLETDDSDWTKKSDGVKQRIYYEQKASPLFLNAGFTANYFISRRCFFSLHASYQQPLQKSYARLITYEDDVEVDRISYETTKVGRNINASLGFGFTVGRKKDRP